MKDANGQFVALGSDFSVLTDTSDEEDDGDERRGGKDGKYGVRDESTRRLLGKVPENAIPRTVAAPVQTAATAGAGGRDDQRPGKRGGKATKTPNAQKKRVRIVV